MEMGKSIITNFVEIHNKWFAITARMQSIIWSDESLEGRITKWKKFEDEINTLIKENKKKESLIQYAFSNILGPTLLSKID